jgi:hypothetical protein
MNAVVGGEQPLVRRHLPMAVPVERAGRPEMQRGAGLACAADLELGCGGDGEGSSLGVGIEVIGERRGGNDNNAVN